MNEQSNIERIVMQRVHLIRALRIAISSGALSSLVSVLALWGIGREVWIARVFENAPSGPLELVLFYAAAFLNTHLSVQLLILVLIGALVYVAWEIFRAAAFISATERA
jgi:hypothetical protein